LFLKMLMNIYIKYNIANDNMIYMDYKLGSYCLNLLFFIHHYVYCADSEVNLRWSFASFRRARVCSDRENSKLPELLK
jgi:hypothetical protein